MHNLEILTRTPLSEQELNWLKENGGNGEGIILSATGIVDLFSGGKAVYFWLRSEEKPPPSYLLEQCWIGEKSVYAPSDSVLEGESLLAHSDEGKENWPLFLAHREVSLVGLHLNDFRGVNSHRFRPAHQVVRATGFRLIDILTLDYVPIGKEREIVIKTTSGGLRMIKVAEDWQGRLKKARPFRFRNWNEVLDVIIA